MERQSCERPTLRALDGDQRSAGGRATHAPRLSVESADQCEPPRQGKIRRDLRVGLCRKNGSIPRRACQANPTAGRKELTYCFAAKNPSSSRKVFVAFDGFLVGKIVLAFLPRPRDL